VHLEIQEAIREAEGSQDAKELQKQSELTQEKEPVLQAAC